jgi:hypothetical protein
VPRSAILTGTVDLVLPIEEMPTFEAQVNPSGS